MKKNIMIAMMIMLVLPIAYAYPRIVVQGFAIKGDARVGNDFTLALNLSDMDQECAINLNTNIQAGPPFIMNGISSHYTAELCQNYTQEIDIPMRIDPTSIGGTYQLTISNTYETASYAEYSSSDILNIFVKGTPEINAYITNSQPLDVYAGDTAIITVSIHNNGNFEAQGLTANLTASAPLTVNWAKSYNIIGTINAKESAPAEYAIEVPKDAPAEDYPMQLTTQYYDENNALQEQTFDFAFHVKPKAKFNISDAGSPSLYSSQNGRIVKYLITNTGTDVAKNVRVKVEPQFPISTDGSVRYIDSLAPGQSVQFEFSVDVDKDGTPGTYGLNMIVDFEDQQGNILQDTPTLSMTVLQRSLFQSIFLDYWFLWLIAIVAVIFILSRKKAKKK